MQHRAGRACNGVIQGENRGEESGLEGVEGTTGVGIEMEV